MTDPPSPDRERAPIVSSRDTKYAGRDTPGDASPPQPTVDYKPPARSSTLPLMLIVIAVIGVAVVIFLVLQLLS